MFQPQGHVASSGVGRRSWEDGGSMYLWNVGILQHYVVSKPGRPRLDSLVIYRRYFNRKVMWRPVRWEDDPECWYG